MPKLLFPKRSRQPHILFTILVCGYHWNGKVHDCVQWPNTPAAVNGPFTICCSSRLDWGNPKKTRKETGAEALWGKVQEAHESAHGSPLLTP